MKPTQPVKPNKDVTALLESMSRTGFQGRKLGESLGVPPVHTRRLSFFSSFRPLAGHFMEAIPDVDWLRGPEREHSLVDET